MSLTKIIKKIDVAIDMLEDVEHIDQQELINVRIKLEDAQEELDTLIKNYGDDTYSFESNDDYDEYSDDEY